MLLSDLPWWTYASAGAILGGVAFRRYCASGSVFRSPHYVQMPDLRGKVYVVTGSNVGIGKSTAEALVKSGAFVIMANRSAERTAPAMEELSKVCPIGPQQLEFIPLDLSDLNSVRQFVETLAARGTQLDGLVNNAGMAASNVQMNKQGFTQLYASNHLGPFALTVLLVQRRVIKDTARIVMVASAASEFAHFDFDDIDGHKFMTTKSVVFDGLFKMWRLMQAYGATKLMNIMFANELARRLKSAGSRITVNAVHPGFVATSLGRDAPALMTRAINVVAKSAQLGAQTSLHVLVSDKVAGVTGQYFVNCEMVRAGNKIGHDEAACARLWKISLDQAGLADAI